MRSVMRLLAVPALVGLAFAGVALNSPLAANAATPRVTIVDNDGPTPAQGIDPRTADWGFAPYHTTVTKGEVVTFWSPKGNKRPHDVVSFTRGGAAPNFTWDVGAKFSSGMTADTYLRAEGSMIPNPAGSAEPLSSNPAPFSWDLDTGTLDPGHYAFICSIHPWMVGTLTVLPAS
jgi:plastocyanin